MDPAQTLTYLVVFILWFVLMWGLGTWAAKGTTLRLALALIIGFLFGIVGLIVVALAATVAKRRHAREPVVQTGPTPTAS